MRIAKAYVPSHITGLFQIQDDFNPLKRGSRGAGVSLSLGVETTVRAERGQRWKAQILINGVPAWAEVSRVVVEEFGRLTSTPHHLTIDHQIAVPVGAGFGTSGAGALGLALALNEALSAGLSFTEAAQVAHLAELKCRTGLGTVLAESVGGVEIRVRAGAPGVGVVVKMPFPEDHRVLAVSWGPLSTRSHLSDETLRGRINELGGPMLEALALNPTLPNLMLQSQGFSEKLNLYTPRLRGILERFEAEVGLGGFSMNLFGEGAFTLIEEERLKGLHQTLERLASLGLRVVVSRIEGEGARLFA